MKLSRTDAVAAGLVAAVVVIYIAYLALNGIPLARGVVGMAAIGLVLGFLSRRIGERAEFAHQRLALAGALGSMAFGIAALITGSEVVLAVFIASIVALCLAAMYVHIHAGAHRGVPVAH